MPKKMIIEVDVAAKTVFIDSGQDGWSLNEMRVALVGLQQAVSDIEAKQQEGEEEMIPEVKEVIHSDIKRVKTPSPFH